MMREDRLAVLRIVLFSAITPLALLVSPVLTGQLIRQYGLAPNQAGTYFLFELGGLSLASLPALWWMRRYPPRRVALVAAILFIIANLVSALVVSLPLLYAVRLLAALAGGTLMVLCMSMAARNSRSDRIFGLWVMGQLVLGAIGLALLPRLFAVFGLPAFFILAAALMAAVLPLAAGFPDLPMPRRSESAIPPGTKTGPGWPVVMIAMVALCSYYIAIGGSWSFMTVIGQMAGVDSLRAADTVAVASLFGIAGAGGASLLGGRLPRWSLLVTGFAILAGALLLLAVFPAAAFLPAAILFKFAWTFALPPVLAVIGDQDTDGAIMSWSNLVIGAGNVLGPMAGGWMLGRYGSSLMLGAEISFVGLSFLLMLVLVLRSKRRGPR